jgi:hypothetical protein
MSRSPSPSLVGFLAVFGFIGVLLLVGWLVLGPVLYSE